MYDEIELKIDSKWFKQIQNFPEKQNIRNNAGWNSFTSELSKNKILRIEYVIKI